ncbi:putative membrane protein [Campylobacter iguaniorum]|uniref:hypothetical protein n=1 Tax=Campylobacter iguaniorum TaxID=1244531 RepID=UPI00073A19E4|nr:hypothetical protein [Campylobacter iguaniorum]ALV23930.1 putative membrane protein [Campylobacter iguaniorum]
MTNFGFTILMWLFGGLIVASGVFIVYKIFIKVTKKEEKDGLGIRLFGYTFFYAIMFIPVFIACIILLIPFLLQVSFGKNNFEVVFKNYILKVIPIMAIIVWILGTLGNNM